MKLDIFPTFNMEIAKIVQNKSSIQITLPKMISNHFKAGDIVKFSKIKDGVLILTKIEEES